MKPIRWGIVGASTIARERMIGAIREARGVVTAVMSQDAERARNYATELGIPIAVTDIDALLPQIDAIYISTTNERHYGACMAAAKAKKHVLCEKPLALRLEDAMAMTAACEQAGVVMGTNHHLRNAATHRAIREAIKAGQIGHPVAARIVHGGPLPPHQQTWRLKDTSGGGGIILDVAVHDVDILRFLLSDEPEDVWAVALNGGLSEPGIEDAAMIQLRFRSGLAAQIYNGYSTPGMRGMVEVHGTKGSVTGLDCMTQIPGGTVSIRTVAGEKHLELQHENYFVRAIRAFHEAIAGRGSPAATGEDGIHSLAAVLAARRSAASGKTERIDGTAKSCDK